MSEPILDKEAWVSIQNGNKILFEGVFRHYYSMLCAFALSKTNDADIAEEIVQDVFVKLWERRTTLDIANFKSYLFTSVNNAVLNHFKHEQVRREHAAEMQIVHDEGDEDDTVEYNELQARVMAVIAQMPDARQKVFSLVKVEGKKYKEVAELLGISVKTVENQMGSALKFLREHLKELFILPPLFL